MEFMVLRMALRALAPALVLLIGGYSGAAVARSAAHGTPALRSNSVYVVDATASTVVLARQADVAMPIASITKLMTALVVLEAGQALDAPVEITWEDRDGTRNMESRLNVGAHLSRADLLHVALMASENRAAYALGRSYPGGTAACVRAMNAKAQALGMRSTRFVEPTGLSSENVASSEDLAKLVLAAAQSPLIQEYSTDVRYVVTIGRHDVEYRNTDSLVRNPTWNIIVQKTGYIAEAGRCLVMKAIVQGRVFVIVLLDSAGKYTRLADARRIRKWLEASLARGALHAVYPSA